MNLSIIEKNNQRVLTTAQLAESYGTDNKRIANNFNENKHRYKQGKHFFLLEGEDLKRFKSESRISGIAPNINKLYLWTGKGAWLHAKSLNTDQAWDAYEKLVDEYYNVTQSQIDTNQLSPELQMFKQIFDSVARTQLKQQEQDKRLDAVEKKQEDIKEVLSLNPTEWKKKVNRIINAIAQSQGGFQAYADVRKESYQLLEERAKCRLSIRLTNKKPEMALNGSAKSKIDKVNKMDVIGDDARLTEIYLAIVKEMAIKYGVGEVS
ncbi:ORF6N domain-containing protein [Bacillus paralicheniformis]|uniref:ORF6N domain-containing protein n=1 Tax=Bacillus paralicheniformis TaxID=1648923 RepID=UPI002DB5D65C|nr:ORF6N domain-containing protein [Bacillus paralicheniformis]MEC1104837.1 ORF6N domain-containing protein [Bacillus paralicheniformis]MEC1147555.1 ORF6N domain-containing protein [Bacillus paralicheniformis]MEC1204766.1 ORF6N domain-containing protein [Bacillus paralicheniformis]MEC1235132.1 ORF6N domain-containing protein [Bacillus paralicheniformis]MEC1240608.1 ORF6N domain-containing protein [Bacillus paralicheniformis]